jgi:hypothetical protein
MVQRRLNDLLSRKPFSVQHSNGQHHNDLVLREVTIEPLGSGAFLVVRCENLRLPSSIFDPDHGPLQPKSFYDHMSNGMLFSYFDEHDDTVMWRQFTAG